MPRPAAAAAALALALALSLAAVGSGAGRRSDAGAPAVPDIGRVVNGTDAAEGEFPFQVSLRFGGSHSCGATLLSESWVLTAAHCVHWRGPGSFSVQAGTTDITDGSGLLVPVAEVREHEYYDPDNNFLNDIAVLRLARPLPLGPLIRPVPLPEPDQDTPAGCPATLVGWGLPYTGGEPMQHLQTVDIEVVSDEECARAHAQRPPHRTNICAGVPAGGKGQCNGDSGGPLLARGRQVGIVSWSMKPCTLRGYPGVFTEVAHYVDWIRQHTLL